MKQLGERGVHLNEINTCSCLNDDMWTYCLYINFWYIWCLCYQTEILRKFIFSSLSLRRYLFMKQRYWTGYPLFHPISFSNDSRNRPNQQTPERHSPCIAFDLKFTQINGMNGHASGTLASSQSRWKTRQEHVGGIDDENESTSTAYPITGNNCR